METAKRECILAEAARAFSKLGFRKASIDEIARKAGVAKGTVYLAVDSKEELFYEVLAREVRAWIFEVGQLIDPRVPAEELLMRASAVSEEKLQHHPLVRDLLYGDCNVLLGHWRDKLDALRESGTANVRSILRIGIDQKAFRADLDVDEVATLLQDLQLAAFVFHGHRSDLGEKMVRRRPAAFDLILNGLRPRR